MANVQAARRRGARSRSSARRSCSAWGCASTCAPAARKGNAIAAAILVVGVPILVYRFIAGLGATTPCPRRAPWGIWIGFDMMTGIVLAAGGFTIGATVQIFGLKEYHPIERPGDPHRLPRLRDGGHRAPRRPRPALEHRHGALQLRHRLGAVRGRLVRHVLHDRAPPRVHGPALRVARLEEAPRASCRRRSSGSRCSR